MPLDQLPVEYLFTIHADTSTPAPTRVRGGPDGDRLIVTAGGGSFEGPKLRGKIVSGPGSEWAHTRTDGSIKADVRLLLETDDGGHILMTYNGIGTVEEHGLVVRTAPLFQTGDERHQWLNRVQAAGIGKPEGDGITYEVYALR